MTRLSLTNMRYIFLLILATTAACTTVTYPRYPVQPIDSYANQQESDGLRVAVHPVSEANELMTYFGSDILKKHRILPLLMTLQNTRSDSSFLFESHKIQLQLVQMRGEATVNQGVESTSEDTYNGIGRITAAGTYVYPILVSPIALVVAIKLADMKNIEYHMQSMELRSDTLSPKMSTQGMIYFQLPEEIDLTKSLTVKIEATNLSTKHNVTILLPLDTGITHRE